MFSNLYTIGAALYKKIRANFSLCGEYEFRFSGETPSDEVMKQMILKQVILKGLEEPFEFNMVTKVNDIKEEEYREYESLMEEE
tara:strand:+ start:456 stop:707 length:252 start_codon:yes stop_codon:yes gene_type:complete